MENFNLLQKNRFDDLNEKIKKNARNLQQQPKLSKREKQVLYLLSLYKKPQSIAGIISDLENTEIKPVTVSGIIGKRLYGKFKCCNIEQLLEKAIMLNAIPQYLE